MEYRYNQALLLYHMEKRDKPLFEEMALCVKESGLAREAVVENMERVFDHIYLYKPDLIIMPIPRTERSIALMSMIKASSHCIIVGYTIEFFDQISEDKTKEMLFYKHRPKELVDYYLFTSRGMAELATKILMKYGLIDDASRVQTFGYLAYDKKIRDKALKQYIDIEGLGQEKTRYKKTVLFALAPMKYPLVIKELMSQTLTKNSDVEQVDRYKKLCRNGNSYSQKYIDTICRIAKDNPNFMIICKTHPAEQTGLIGEGMGRYEKFREYQNIYFIDRLVPISSLFQYSDVFVHYGSTTALEAYIYKVRSLGLADDSEMKCETGYLEGAIYGNDVVYINNYDEIQNIIRSGEGFKNNKTLDEKLKYYVDYCDEYSPRQKLIDIFKNVNLVQSMRRDSETRRLLHYRSCIKKYFIFRLREIRAMVSGDNNTKKLISDWFDHLHKSL